MNDMYVIIKNKASFTLKKKEFSFSHQPSSTLLPCYLIQICRPHSMTVLKC